MTASNGRNVTRLSSTNTAAAQAATAYGKRWRSASGAVAASANARRTATGHVLGISSASVAAHSSRPAENAISSLDPSSRLTAPTVPALTARAEG